MYDFTLRTKLDFLEIVATRHVQFTTLIITYHLSITGLFINDGDVCPVKEFDKIDHHFGLILVRWYCSHEEWKSFCGAQCWTC